MVLKTSTQDERIEYSQSKKDFLSYGGLKRILYDTASNVTASTGAIVGKLVDNSLSGGYEKVEIVDSYDPLYSNVLLESPSMEVEDLISTAKLLGVLSNNPRAATIENFLTNIELYKDKQNTIFANPTEKSKADYMVEVYKDTLAIHKPEWVEEEVINQPIGYTYLPNREELGKAMGDKIFQFPNHLDLIDIKTTSKNSLEEFLYDAKKFDYPLQMAWYMEVYKEAYQLDIPINPWWVVLTQSKCYIIPIPEEIIEDASNLVSKAISLKKQKENNGYKSYDKFFNTQVFSEDYLIYKLKKYGNSY